VSVHAPARDVNMRAFNALIKIAKNSLQVAMTAICRRFITARCTLVQSAVLRLHVFRLSVCLSVTLVDQGHVGRKSWKLTARTISPTSLLFLFQRPSIPRGTWGNLGETRGGVRKSGVLEHKSGNISETRKRCKGR